MAYRLPVFPILVMVLGSSACIIANEPCEGLVFDFNVHVTAAAGDAPENAGAALSANVQRWFDTDGCYAFPASGVTVRGGALGQPLVDMPEDDTGNAFYSAMQSGYASQYEVRVGGHSLVLDAPRFFDIAMDESSVTWTPSDEDGVRVSIFVSGPAGGTVYDATQLADDGGPVIIPADTFAEAGDYVISVHRTRNVYDEQTQANGQITVDIELPITKAGRVGQGGRL